MKKILVITDLSRNSRAGIKFGIQLAAQAGYDLEFYHVVEIMKPTSWNDSRFDDFKRKRLLEIENKIRKQVKEIGIKTGHDASLRRITLEVGTKVIDNTLAYAKKSRASFICLGTRGGGTVKKMFGSNAANFLISSPVPVIVVPPRYRARTVTKLMYASDFENLGGEFRQVRAFSSDLGADLGVFHYNRTLVINDDKSWLRSKASRFADKRTKFVFRKLEVDRPLSNHLSREIKKEKPDALVLFTRPKRSWFNRLFSPSKSAEMVLDPVLPIVVYRKKE